MFISAIKNAMQMVVEAAPSGLEELAFVRRKHLRLKLAKSTRWNHVQILALNLSHVGTLIINVCSDATKENVVLV